MRRHKKVKYTIDVDYRSSYEPPLITLLDDFKQGFGQLGRVASLAMIDIRQRYQRSVLGPLWITLGTAVFLTGFILIGSRIFGTSRDDYAVFLVFSVLFWQLVVTVFNESTDIFWVNNAYILANNEPLSIWPIRTIIRNLLVFAHSVPVAIGVLALLGEFSIHNLMVIPNTVLIVLFFFSASCFLGVLGARFKDLRPAVMNSMQFGFYLTPVLWPDDLITDYPARLIVDFNPFFHLLELYRRPFLGEYVDLNSYLFVGGFTLFFALTAFWLYLVFYRRIKYWI